MKIKTVIIGLLVIGSVVTAMAGETDQKMLEKDMQIMEKVLYQLIIQDSPIWFSGSDNVKGVYLKGFGVLYDFQSIGFSNERNDWGTFIIDTDDNGHINIDTKKKKEAEEKALADARKKLDKTRQLLLKFYTDYASAVKSMDNDEHICVNIRLVNDYISDWDLKNVDVPKNLRSCIKVSELEKYRQGKISEDKLAEKINFIESNESVSDDDVEIMAGIFDTMLNSDEDFEIAGFKVPIWGKETSGMYLDDFGVLFFTKSSAFQKKFFNSMISFNGKEKKLALEMKDSKEEIEDLERQIEELSDELGELDELDEKLKMLEKELKVKEKELEKIEDKRFIVVDADEDDQIRINLKSNFILTESEKDSVLDVYETKIFDVLARYGHTLRKVQDDEYIMVVLDMNTVIGESGMSNLNIKVKKGDVLDYFRDKIELKDLKKKSEIWRS